MTSILASLEHGLIKLLYQPTQAIRYSLYDITDHVSCVGSNQESAVVIFVQFYPIQL
jgi:hypothetical protein